MNNGLGATAQAGTSPSPPSLGRTTIFPTVKGRVYPIDASLILAANGHGWTPLVYTGIG